ncbi:MAG TPA: molybdopterin converting factor subunit 1 [Bacteroidota bacterium]|nr:molybdopterin converting factor subunit 1 [Bacteroidota bacterium]
MKGIRVRVFGRVKEIVGSDEIDLPAGAGETTGTVLKSLIDRYPPLAPWRDYLRVAVNQEYVPDERTVSPGDEVAIIPPVSGG